MSIKLGPIRISIGVDKPVAKLDLTLREVNEAEAYRLTPDQYDELRTKLEKRIRDKVTPEVEKFKAEIRDQQKVQLTKELTPKIREEVLAECKKQAETDLRATCLKEAHEEVLTKAPGAKDREAFKEFVREAEMDCLTQANAASADSEIVSSSYRWNRRIRYPLAWALFLSSPMLAFFLYNIYSWGLGFWAYLIPLIVGAIGFAYHTNDKDEKLAPLRAHFGKIASDYWVLAERAKKLRIVTANAALDRGFLNSTLQDFTQSKKDLDDKYLPSAKALEISRAEIRSQLLIEVDPEKLLRVASDRDEEFEALEESEEAAKQRAG